MKNKLIKLAGVAAAVVALAQTVQATPIIGNIGFTGNAIIDSSSGVQNATAVTNWSNIIVGSESGSFTSVALGAAVTMAAPWSFTSGSLPALWKVGGFTFNLTSSTGQLVTIGSSTFELVTLTGMVTGNSYTPTAFTGTFDIANPAADNVSTFTARLSFTAVPDGGTTVLLLGAALSGLALIKRKMTA